MATSAPAAKYPACARTIASGSSASRRADQSASERSCPASASWLESPPSSTSRPQACPACPETTSRTPLPAAAAPLPSTRPEAAPAPPATRPTIEPGYGELARPGGYGDYGESWQQGAARDLREETGIHADPADVT